MIDREKVIKALEVCSSISDGEECPKECPYMGQDVYCIGSSGLMLDALDLMKEQEEQKRKWLNRIADAQITVSPTGFESAVELAKRTGEWNGLQMAFDILTEADGEVGCESITSR